MIQSLFSLLALLELILPFEKLEEGLPTFSKSRDEAVECHHASSELLDVLDARLRVHVGDRGDLLWIFFDASVTNDEPE